jgi:transcriptional regulator with XRE-family HTH domain
VLAGERLRQLRERLGLSIRDVEAASNQIAERFGNSDFGISLSRLSDIETKGITPNIYKIYSLAAIYRRSFNEIVELYGIDLAATPTAAGAIEIPKTHKITSIDGIERLSMPIEVDPGFNPRTTTAIGRMVVNWGVAPFSLLEQFQTPRYSYGYVGMEDLTMYPLLLPGTFVQIDEERRKIQDGPWRSEYERPIYFLETREGFVCSWCELNPPMLTVRPHPLSPARTKSYKHGTEIEILGQVVGIAMRLNGWLPNDVQRSDAG